jgi:hypothetical protein
MENVKVAEWNGERVISKQGAPPTHKNCFLPNRHITRAAKIIKRIYSNAICCRNPFSNVFHLLEITSCGTLLFLLVEGFTFEIIKQFLFLILHVFQTAILKRAKIFLAVSLIMHLKLLL